MAMRVAARAVEQRLERRHLGPCRPDVAVEALRTLALTGHFETKEPSPPDAIRYENGVFVASSWARELPGLPKERNVHGVSLAVAHVTGMAAALLGGSVAKSELADRLAHG
ncbi:MAG: hypothetical protein BMS9Abin37_2814 [Acidobacteriota bacterium]|nr:MAG: hypothetical protein BMS9Abin37_2814 [Acidobacteriota bacterium]